MSFNFQDSVFSLLRQANKNIILIVLNLWWKVVWSNGVEESRGRGQWEESNELETMKGGKGNMLVGGNEHAMYDPLMLQHHYPCSLAIFQSVPDRGC